MAVNGDVASGWLQLCCRIISALAMSAASATGSAAAGRSASAADDSSRCVLHLDVDSFYCACEFRRRPELRNKPLAVTQYNSGGFVAVSEAARRSGVRKG